MTRRLRSLALGLAPALLLVACTGGPAAPTSPPASIPRSATPIASAPPVPSPSGADTPGSIAGNPGLTPIPITGPSGSNTIIPAPSPTEVAPVANLLEVHDVRADSFKVDGSSGTVKVTILWWSGPAPCSELSGVKIARSDASTGTSFTLTVREGAQQLGVGCPALAVHKQTTVDLGPIRDQNWTIAVVGVDQPQAIHMGG